MASSVANKLIENNPHAKKYLDGKVREKKERFLSLLTPQDVSEAIQKGNWDPTWGPAPIMENSSGYENIVPLKEARKHGWEEYALRHELFHEKDRWWADLDDDTKYRQLLVELRALGDYIPEKLVIEAYQEMKNSGSAVSEPYFKQMMVTGTTYRPTGNDLTEKEWEALISHPTATIAADEAVRFIKDAPASKKPRLVRDMWVNTESMNYIVFTRPSKRLNVVVRVEAPESLTPGMKEWVLKHNLRVSYKNTTLKGCIVNPFRELAEETIVNVINGTHFRIIDDSEIRLTQSFWEAIPENTGTLSEEVEIFSLMKKLATEEKYTPHIDTVIPRYLLGAGSFMQTCSALTKLAKAGNVDKVMHIANELGMHSPQLRNIALRNTSACWLGKYTTNTPENMLLMRSLNEKEAGKALKALAYQDSYKVPLAYRKRRK